MNALEQIRIGGGDKEWVIKVAQSLTVYFRLWPWEWETRVGGGDRSSLGRRMPGDSPFNLNFLSGRP